MPNRNHIFLTLPLAFVTLTGQRYALGEQVLSPARLKALPSIAAGMETPLSGAVTVANLDECNAVVGGRNCFVRSANPKSAGAGSLVPVTRREGGPPAGMGRVRDR